MKAAIKFIPNLLTLGNALMGLWAIVFIAREEMLNAVYCVAIALILDFFDGFVARLLKAQSPLGVQLDSLADAITFGLVPGFILFQMIAIAEGFYFVEITKWPTWLFLEVSVAGLVPLAAIYRLAKFNLKTDAGTHFSGLPTPAMTLFVLGIPLALEANYHLNFYHPISPDFVQLLGEIRKWDMSDVFLVNLLFKPSFYITLSVILSMLMVSNLPMLSLKFSGVSWKKNKWSYALIIWAVIAYIIFLIPYFGGLPLTYGLIDYLILPIFMLGYFVLSLIYTTFGAENRSTDEVQS